MAIYTICSSCGRKLLVGTKCEVCNKERYKQYKRFRKDKKEQAFYSSREWKVVSEVTKLKYLGLCVKCWDNGELKSSAVTHHIKELKEDWSLKLEPSNLIPICNRCHDKIHKEYKKNKSEEQNKLRASKGKFEREYKI